MFTRTEWYIVPLVWTPIFAVIFLRSALQFANIAPPSIFHSAAYTPISLFSIPLSAFAKTGICFLIGNIIWKILEYTMHRFLFHIDAWLPDRPFFLMLHFLLHGIHHYLPMDGYAFLFEEQMSGSDLFHHRLRLVMPPLLFFVLQLPFTQLAYILFPVAIANGIISGSFAFCTWSSPTAITNPLINVTGIS